jgi:L,D-transpeptidase YcbB
MRLHRLAISLLALIQALAVLPALAQDQAVPATGQEAAVTPAPIAAPAAAPAVEPPLAQPEPSVEPKAAQPEPAVPADPVVATIREKLADPAVTKDANPGDAAALQAFYAARSEPPLWITEMGFSAKGQEAIFEIEKAGDWGLDAAAFDLPPPGEMPANAEAQALAEIKLALAILKYARHARGGRVTPLEVSKLYDQRPPLRDPSSVLAEIAAAETPDTYLVSLQPKHEEFQRLRAALLKARGQDSGTAAPLEPEANAAEVGEKKDEAAADESKPAKPASEKDIKRILLNMERWRWLPENLGDVYVWNNSPEFMVYVVKNGKPIYADKILVGTPRYATPVFSDEMETIVFNPDWIAPPTVVKENVLPHLRAGNYGVLKTHKLSVSYNGSPVNAAKVNWSKVNGLSYTFSQKGGPGNNLGKAKFLFPNAHIVYMHDTLPVRKKYFKEKVRMIGHECVRMEKPDKFAEVLLAESDGMSAEKVQALWDGGINGTVNLKKKLPVHMVYFTATVDENGKMSTFTDVYGLDRKLALALFKDAGGFPEAAPDKSTEAVVSSSRSSRPRASSGTGIAGSVGFFD